MRLFTELIHDAIPSEDTLSFLVQNAAIGVPGRMGEIKRSDFDNAMAVNVTAPLMLTQKLLPKLQKSKVPIFPLPIFSTFLI